MANLVVTNVCNLKCGFCFAGDYFGSSRRDSRSRFISPEAFDERLNFLLRSHIHEIRLIGGEPSLHPHFSDLIERARRTGRHIVVFSHGFLSEPAATCLESLPIEQCTVLINMNATLPAGRNDPRQPDPRLTALRRLGQRAIAGFNISEVSPQLDFLLPLILEADCRRVIRLGLAHPVLSGHNTYLHPKQYRAAGIQIARFARVAADAGVRLEFDCGFVRCMFSEEDLEMLHATRADLGWRCNPILDVDLTEQVFHCFPLSSKVAARLLPDSVAADLRAGMIEETRHYRRAGIYKKCSSCSFKQRGECTGGCLAHTMKRFRRADFRLTVPQHILY